ncbi:MAG: PAS domain-containing protein [Candidatus Omnitrophica bacterium]|nr:PAS domain-containing protein [Candidatus Omnitrophota bacterium]
MRNALPKSRCGFLSCVFVVVLIIPNSWGVAPANWRYWNVLDGLVESHSRSISLNPDGRIWINHGDVTKISCLDGFRIDAIVSPGPRMPVRESLFHQIWSISDEFLKIYEHDQWMDYPLEGIQSTTPFLPIAPNKALVVFPESFVLYDAEQKIAKELKSSSNSQIGPFTDMTRSMHLGIWVTGQRGVAKIEKIGTILTPEIAWEEYSFQGANFENFRAPHQSGDGELLMIASSTESRGNAILRYADQTLTNLYTSLEDLVRVWRGPRQSLWALTEDQLIQIQNRIPQPVENEFMMQNRIYDVECEPDGSFWLAASHGIARYAAPLWENPCEELNIESTVHAIYEDANERIWFVSTNALLLLEKEAWKMYPFPSDVKSHRYETDALCVLADGRVLMNCSKTPYLLSFDPAAESFQLVSHPLGKKLRFIAPAAGGQAWIRTQEYEKENFCLERFDGDHFELVVDFAEEEDVIRVRHLRETENGDLWIGHLYGLGFFNREESRYTEIDDYPGNGAFWIQDINSNVIWVGGRNKIYEYDGESWNEIKANLDAVSSMLVDKNNSVWIASGTGLHRYWKGSFVTHTSEDGLPSTITSKVFEDHRGRIWIGASRGVGRLRLESDQDPPDAMITDDSDMKEIAPEGNVQFHFTGMDKWKSTREERLLFSYRVNDSEWSPFRETDYATLNHLPSGIHRFEVRAMDRNWNVDPSPAAFQFEVLQPWHHTWQFILIAFLGSLIIIILILIITFYAINLKSLVQERTTKLVAANKALKEEIAERKLAEETLQSSEKLYREAIEAANAVPYYRNYLTDRYDFMGDGIESITGFSNKEITPAIWKEITLDFIPLGELSGLSREEAIQKVRSISHIIFRADYLIKTKDGKMRWMENTAVEVRNEEGEIVGSLGMLLDITERMHKETALRESEAKNQALLNAIPDVMVRIRKDGTYLDCKSPHQLTPYAAPGEIIGKTVQEVLPKEVAYQVIYQMSRTLKTGKPGLFEYRLHHESLPRDYEARIVQSGGDEVLIIIRDVTERKQLEEEVLHIRETERKRIGNELHDELCQYLTGIALRSKVLEERLSTISHREQEHAREITHWINKAISQTRFIARGLHPITLETYGLQTAIEELLANTQKMFDVSCRLYYDKDISIPDKSTAMHLYRIIQEALNNAIRHGRAKHIRVNVTSNSNHILLRVEDDGVGIPPNIENAAGMGIRIMKYRARMIKASLQFQALNNQGTIVACSIPKFHYQESPL